VTGAAIAARPSALESDLSGLLGRRLAGASIAASEEKAPACALFAASSYLVLPGPAVAGYATVATILLSDGTNVTFTTTDQFEIVKIM